MHREAGFPLDYQSSGYAYVERPNSALIALLEKHVLREQSAARILDVGCGAGANARRIAELAPDARVVGIEPNPRAAESAKSACHGVFCGTFQAWLETKQRFPRSADDGRPVHLDTTPRDDRDEVGEADHGDQLQFDAVLLSDVLEHTVDPVAFLRDLHQCAPLRAAKLLISVPNYAVWYNRLRTLAGRFDYAWSGLYDRTHLRFYTRKSLGRVLAYTGFEVVADACTPSLVQSSAPLLRRFFERDVARGDHLSLTNSRAFSAYERLVEPLETRLCALWPELLGFQNLCVAERR